MEKKDEFMRKCEKKIFWNEQGCEDLFYSGRIKSLVCLASKIKYKKK